ncbi:MAG: porin [Planctomycetota bacterium]|nr:porin [Planctomycetota bacterium]
MRALSLSLFCLALSVASRTLTAAEGDFGYVRPVSAFDEQGADSIWNHQFLGATLDEGFAVQSSYQQPYPVAADGPALLDLPPTDEEDFSLVVDPQVGSVDTAKPGSEGAAKGEEKKEEKKDEKKDKKEEEKKWYDKMKIRGYVQFRYNQLLVDNNQYRTPWDRSVGENNGFFIRRARMVFSGDATDWLSFYIQPDFAANADDQLHYLQLRDLYADIFLDPCKEHRLRVGQSKVPYGWENLQSSQNRLPFDRDDALNSGVPNERDIGIMYYWAPDYIRERFKFLVDEGLKGSGDYGALGLGVYNGQTANRPERNDDRHVVARISWPFLLESGQIVEAGMSGYYGEYVMATDHGIIGNGQNFLDKRLAWHLIYYPQPFGFQAEYTIGRGPELNGALTEDLDRSLHGGYAMLYYKLEKCIPYARYQRYLGGNKLLINSPDQDVSETEIGVEWQFAKALELTTSYMYGERATYIYPYEVEKGGLLRLQLQWNY